MRRARLIGGLFVLAIAVVVGAVGVAVAQPSGGDYGWMGPSMMYGNGPGGSYGPGWMGPGMMNGNGSGGGYGPGWMGPGMMHGNGSGGGYGPGWMGPGMMYGNAPGGGDGPGWMGPGMMYGRGYGPGAGGWQAPQQANLNLSVDQAKTNMQRWLQAMGNTHVKLGDVVEKDADTITADIVTTDKDALVQRYEINRHTGFILPAG